MKFQGIKLPISFCADVTVLFILGLTWLTIKLGKVYIYYLNHNILWKEIQLSIGKMYH